MPKKKPLFIWGSDFHIHYWKQFNECGSRFKNSLDLITTFAKLSRHHKVPILFTGDFFENAKKLDNEVITRALEVFSKHYSDHSTIPPFIAISGNHDQSKANTLDQPSPSYLQGFHAAFDKFLLIDNTWIESQGHLIMGIPYLAHNMGFKAQLKAFRAVKTNKKKILLIHTDLHGAKDTSGRPVGTTQNINKNLKKAFRGFDLVLSGHIHLPQIIYPKLVYMCGSPQQQSRTDMGVKMGYWIIYDNLSLEFIPLSYPQFKEYEENTPIPDTFNYYTAIPQSKTTEENADSSTKFHAKTNRAKIAKRWAKEVGVKNKTRIKLLIKTLNKAE